MIEFLIFQELQERTGFPVYPKVPATLPDTFIVCQKTGSSLDNHIKTATFAIQSYGRNQDAAAVLNELVKEKMLSMIDLDEISSVSLNGDYNYTDTQEKKDRYQAVFVITHY